MYKAAEKRITQGLSLFPRLILASFSGLFAAVMFLVAPPNDKAVYFYMFGIFCALICIASITTGRLRQFVGSIIGVALFGLSILYLLSQVQDGLLFSFSRGEPSVLNALLFLVFFGLPGLAYAIKAKFGFPRVENLTP